MNITFGGDQLTLVGKQVSKGQRANDFTVIKNDLSEFKLNELEGIKVISVIPSIDTGVCDQQTRKFNEELSGLATVLTISNDLPFAQARWCGASGLENVLTLSDHKDLSFANAFGCLIEELRLLTRAVFVLDSKNTIVHVEYLHEITNHPNYDQVIRVVKGL